MMFTDCPACGRQFRVQAHHLSAAAGQVRCGFCGRQFDALARLRDKPLPHARMELPEALPPEPEFDIPVPGPETAQSHPPGMDELPVQLLPETEPGTGGRVRLVWGVGVVLLLLAGAAQGAWFNRDALLEHFPQAQPWAKLVCERIHCSLPQFRDLSAIKVINRDVRQHPRYKNSLLVNATIANTSRHTQPFPRIRLVLFDTNGRVVAWRDFDPKEYLDASMNVEHGMAPDVPVHLVLEVTGATKGAVSFEFGFL